MIRDGDRQCRNIDFDQIGAGMGAPRAKLQRTGIGCLPHESDSEIGLLKIPSATRRFTDDRRLNKLERADAADEPELRNFNVLPVGTRGNDFDSPEFLRLNDCGIGFQGEGEARTGLCVLDKAFGLDSSLDHWGTVDEVSPGFRVSRSAEVDPLTLSLDLRD